MEAISLDYRVIRSATMEESVNKTARIIVALNRIFSPPLLVCIVALSVPPNVLPRLASLLCKRIDRPKRTESIICTIGQYDTNAWAKNFIKIYYIKFTRESKGQFLNQFFSTVFL